MMPRLPVHPVQSPPPAHLWGMSRFRPMQTGLPSGIEGMRQLRDGFGFGSALARGTRSRIWLHNRKRPGGEPRRILGLLQGGEICISIYVDPWEVGGPFDAPRAIIVGSDERHMGDAEPSQKVFCSAPYRLSSANP